MRDDVNDPGFGATMETPYKSVWTESLDTPFRQAWVDCGGLKTRYVQAGDEKFRRSSCSMVRPEVWKILQPISRPMPSISIAMPST